MSLIYLDYCATTPCDPRVVESMTPYFTNHFGNASSKHHPYGWHSAQAVDHSRNQLASLLNVDSKDIIFTSGATESLNLAIKGICATYATKGNHIITCSTEHNAVLDTCEFLEKSGIDVTYLDVDSNGNIDLDQLLASIRKETLVVCLMWANNETGQIHPIAAIGEICKEKGIFFGVDATQAVGKTLTHPIDHHIDFLAWSAHKMYGPKGIGGLYLNPAKKIKLQALIHGGGQEKALRAGTLNVPGIVGFGKAAEIAFHEMVDDAIRIKSLKDYLEEELTSISLVTINAAGANRLPHVSNIWFRFVENELLLATFNHTMALSTGSACSTSNNEPSHVLKAMGLSDDQAKNCLRISIGKYTTQTEIKAAIDFIKAGIEKVRSESPKWQMHLSGMDLSSY
jgi:cysteine desulfurase